VFEQDRLGGDVGVEVFGQGGPQPLAPGIRRVEQHGGHVVVADERSDGRTTMVRGIVAPIAGVRGEADQASGLQAGERIADVRQDPRAQGLDDRCPQRAIRRPVHRMNLSNRRRPIGG
jgi:hypothetical protein